MPFTTDGTIFTASNADYGADFDWYDGGMDFDYDRSGPTPDGAGPVIPNLTDPDNIPEVEIVGKAPEPYKFPDDMLIPPGDILQPVPPPDINDIPDMGTIDIVDKRPVAERPVIPEGPGIELPPYNPPIIEAPDIIEPVPPVVEDDVPEMVITDDRPVVPPVTPDVIVPPDIVEPPIVDPEPPVIPPVVEPEPPVIPPYVPPYVPPTVVTPPPVTPVTPVTPTPVQSGQYLNPGLIETTPFYKTTSPEQSKYYWGTGRPLQYGTEFNAKTWNDVPSAERTAWSASPTVSAPMPILSMQAQDLHSMLSGASSQGASNLSAEQLKDLMRLLSGR